MFNMILGNSQNNQPKQTQPEPYWNKSEIIQPEEAQPDLSQGLENSSQSEAPTHFDDLIGAASSSENDGAGAGSIPPADKMLSREDFHKLFVGGFKAGHHLSGLQSLMLEDGNEAARDCAYALHETIVDIPMLHFILQPGNKWLDRAFAVGLFTVPMAMSVRTEIAARNRPAQQSANFSAAKAATRPRNAGDPDAAQVSALTGRA